MASFDENSESTNNETLSNAIMNCDIDKVKAFLESECSLVPEDIESSPLYLSVQNNQIDIARLLLLRTPKVDLKVFEDLLMMTAIKNNSYEMLHLLIEFKVNINSRDVHGYLPLHKAVEMENKQIIELLLDHNANIDARTRDTSETPLQIAILLSCYEVIELLLDRGADVNSISAAGFTPLHFAVKQGHPKIICTLLEHGANVDCKTSKGMTPLILAITGSNLDAFKIILQHNPNLESKSQDSKTALHFAAEHGQTEMVQILLERKANVSVFNQYGHIPLHLAAQFGSLDITRMLAEQSDVNYTDNFLETPLHMAVKYDHAEVVRLLIDLDASLECLNIFHETPLYLAAMKGYSQIVELLISANSCIDAPTNYGDTPLLSALKFGHIGIAELLLQHGANINVIDAAGNTPLIEAIELQDRDRLMFLLDNGASLNAAGVDGPPLYYAIKYNSPFVGMLIERGAYVHYCDEDNSTMLHYAIQFDNCDALEQLLKKNVDIKREKDSCTALQFALARDFNRCAEILLTHCYQQQKANVPVGTKNIIAMDKFMISLQRVIKKDMKKFKSSNKDVYNHLKKIWKVIRLYMKEQFRSHKAESSGLIEYTKLRMKMWTSRNLFLRDRITYSFVVFILEEVLEIEENFVDIIESLEMILTTNN